MQGNDNGLHPLDNDPLEDFSKYLELHSRLSTSKEDFLKNVKEEIANNNHPTTKREIKGLVDRLDQRSSELSTRVRFFDVGTVQHIGNGIATVSGLPNVSIDEIVTFPTGVEGMALNLERKRVDLIMLGSEKDIRGGDLVQATGKRLHVPVGAQLLGRVIDSLGNPLDGDEPLDSTGSRVLAKIAPSVIYRSPVNEPLYTGTKVIDSLFPIGRGQRELILGDRQTGKTTLAVDAILNQKGTNVRCIYVAIGQKKSSTLAVIETLRKHNALQNTTVVIGSPDDQPALRYLAPFTGITIAEHFLDQGMDVLIVFDDLSKHADAYRELSLLLRRPPGREAYPGDIFYLHSRLLERACKMDQAHGGGSITALPIATTQNGNLATYIPTNLISITDGQIVLDTNTFNEGQKPAVDIGRSVSRVGSAAQRPAVHKLVGNLKLELSQFKEVEHFSRFGTEVDNATNRQVQKGKTILNTFKQKPHQPVPFSMLVVFLFALENDYLSPIPLSDLETFQDELQSDITVRETKLLSIIDKEGQLTEEIVDQLGKVLEGFTSSWLEKRGGVL